MTEPMTKELGLFWICLLVGHDIENVMLVEQRDAHVVCRRCGHSFDSPEPIKGYPMRHWHGSSIPDIKTWYKDLDSRV